ncbi:MAG: DNA primase [Candidatus Falkowbacteria bacterium]
MQQPSDEIKSRLDIVDVIREYIQLKPAGINFRANCPFHHEKTPSFMVSPEKQIWHCFGCQEGGDVFSFVMKIEGINFVEALRLLAPKAGVQLKAQNPKLTSQRNRLLDILDLSSRYYNKVLMESAQSKWVRDYLENRGLEDNIIEEWRIGYSPESWDDLINFLKSKGYNDGEIFSAGMSIKKEGTGRYYNRFRDRIMFPIRDVNSNVLAFSARVNPSKEEEDKLGKYINSPQTMIYDKSKVLFGLDKAKLEIKKHELAIIVEGQMDVITAHQHGFKNVIASSGTALTEDQVSLIKRYSQNIALAFDMDKAGELAAKRGIDQAMKAEMNIKVIEVPNGKDPDECIKNNQDEWVKAIKSAKHVMQYYLDKTISGLDLDKVEDKRTAVKIFLPIIMKLYNKIEQDFWLKKISQKLDVEENLLREALNNAQKKNEKVLEKQNQYRNIKLDNKKEVIQKKQSREEMLSELLLALMMKFPSHIEYISSKIIPDHIVGLQNQAIYKDLIIYYNKANNESEINYQDFKESQPQVDEKILNRLVFLAERDFYDYDHEKAKSEIIKILVDLKKHYLSQRLREITKLITQAEKEKNQDELKNLMNEFKILAEEINN